MPEGAKNSRLKSLKEEDENSSFLKLPNIEGAEYLVGLLYEAGLAGSNGMGIVSLSWSELNNWRECTESNLSTWEILTIKSLSEAYVSEYSQASERNRPAPYLHVEEEVTASRARVASKLKNAFAAFKKSASPVTK